MMYSFFKIFTVLNQAFYNNAMVQNSDTTYITLEPLVLKKQVIIYVEPPKENPKRNHLKNWWFSAGFHINKYTAVQTLDSIQKDFGLASVPSLQAGYKFKNNWMLSAGISYSQSQLKATYTNKTDIVDTIIVAKYDSTITSISISVPEGIVYEYDIDTSYVKAGRHTLHENAASAQEQISYWQIPVRIAYHFSYGKIYLQPSISTTYHFRIASKLNNNEQKIPITKNYLSTAVGLQFGLMLSKHISIELGGQYFEQRSRLKEYLKLNQVSGNVAMRYFF